MGLQRRWYTSSGGCVIVTERESRICTSMYSSGLFPISSGTITWNMYDGEPTTCMKFIKLHKRSNCFQSWIASKYIFNLCIPDPNAAAWLNDRERICYWCYLLCPVLVEIDWELRSRSEAYLLTLLQLTSLVPVAWMPAWVSQLLFLVIACFNLMSWQWVGWWHGSKKLRNPCA